MKAKQFLKFSSSSLLLHKWKINTEIKLVQCASNSLQFSFLFVLAESNKKCCLLCRYWKSVKSKNSREVDFALISKKGVVEGKGRKRMSRQAKLALWYTSWAPVAVEESEGRCPQTMKQAVKSCGPDCCEMSLIFSSVLRRREQFLI